MKELALLHKDYIKQSYIDKGMGRTDIRQDLINTYIAETGDGVCNCSDDRGFLNKVLPAYIKMAQDNQ
jgi:hypothetical protein